MGRGPVHVEKTCRNPKATEVGKPKKREQLTVTRTKTRRKVAAKKRETKAKREHAARKEIQEIAVGKGRKKRAEKSRERKVGMKSALLIATARLVNRTSLTLCLRQ